MELTSWWMKVRCHVTFSKYPRAAIGDESLRIIACDGKIVELNDMWTQIEVDAIVVHFDDSEEEGVQQFKTRIRVKTDAIISVEDHG